MVRKMLVAGVATLALGVGAVQAQDNRDGDRLLGATAAGTTGAVAGAVIGGPVGAIIGGFAGAVIGAEAAVPSGAVDYVVANPVEPVYFEGEVSSGVPLPETVTLYEIPDYPEYGYVYLDERPVVVELASRQVVYSPGVILPDTAVTYVEQNPLDPVVVDTEIVTGAVLPQEIEVIELPDYPTYGYIYTESGPVLVERGTRTVIWVD